MSKITREAVREAFMHHRRKRNLLLYEHYQEAYFSKEYNADFIAQRISEDLQITITAGIIYKIHHRIVKNQRPNQPPELEKRMAPVPQTRNNIKNIGLQPEGNEPEFVFKNADEYPKPDPFGEAFDNIP